MNNNSYDTLSLATNDLASRGYTISFSLKRNGIEDGTDQRLYPPDQFLIDEFHRFEGDTDPGDMSIVFAVTTKDGRKGVIIDAYGVYEDPLESEMLHKIRISRS